MKYRTLPKLPDIKLSQFGMGIMRMPTVMVDDVKKIDREQGEKMVEAAIAGGVNYFDSGYYYHSGDSEKFIAEYVVPKMEKHNLHIATKLPQWVIKDPKDYDKFLNDQLTRLGVKQIEFYLVHSFGDESWEKHKEMGIIDFLKRAVADGRIKYPAFSYHGSLGTFKKIIDAYDDWVFAQIMLNYIDENWQAGVEGMRYAHSKNLGVVIMEPLKGGMLINQLPPNVREYFDKLGVDPVEAAMDWCYNYNEPTIVLSGVSSLEHTIGQVEIASKAEVGGLTDKQREAIEFSKSNFDLVPCSGCEYCKPCPAGVDIPTMIEFYNSFYVFGNEGIKVRYPTYVKMGWDAGRCMECGACESVCPQGIDIMNKMKKTHEALSK